MYASYSKLSKELKNIIKIEEGQVLLELLIQTNILTVLIYNLKTAWSTNISMPFWNPWTIFYKMHNLFFKKLIIFG